MWRVVCIISRAGIGEHQGALLGRRLELWGLVNEQEKRILLWGTCRSVPWRYGLMCYMGSYSLVTAGVAEDGTKGRCRSLSLILGTKGSHRSFLIRRMTWCNSQFGKVTMQLCREGLDCVKTSSRETDHPGKKPEVLSQGRACGSQEEVHRG